MAKLTCSFCRQHIIWDGPRPIICHHCHSPIPPKSSNALRNAAWLFLAIVLIIGCDFVFLKDAPKSKDIQPNMAPSIDTNFESTQIKTPEEKLGLGLNEEIVSPTVTASASAPAPAPVIATATATATAPISAPMPALNPQTSTPAIAVQSSLPLLPASHTAKGESGAQETASSPLTPSTTTSITTPGTAAASHPPKETKEVKEQKDAPRALLGGTPSPKMSSPTMSGAPTGLSSSEQIKPTQDAEKAPFAPSFDCLKVSSNADFMVCNDRELSNLDLQMSHFYKLAREATEDKLQLRAEQIAWIKTKKACDTKACLEKAYHLRITQLSNR